VNLREFRRILRQTLLLPILLLPMLAGFIVWQITESSNALRSLDHSDRITGQIVGLQKLIIDQETGLRGYQLTGDRAMLEPYKAATGPIEAHFKSLRGLLENDPVELGRLAVLRDRYQIWLGFAETELAKKPAPAGDIELNRNGKELMDNVRAESDEMLGAEAQVRKQRSAMSIRIERREFVAVLGAALVVGILLGIFTRSRVNLVSRTYDARLKELERNASELYQSRQWFRTTLESIGDAVIACDNEGKVQFMNAVAQALTGWTTQEAMGQPLQKVFHIINEETRKEAENPVEKVRRLKEVVGLANHTALISQQGKEFVIDDSGAPILDEKGEMTGIVLVFRDVTEDRRKEAALIAGEKLAVAGRLAASIAHEIHNPLDLVTNLLFLLSNEADPEKRAEYIQIAQQEVARTMQISRTMLSLYREPKAPVTVDLKELLEGVLLLLDRRLAQQNITVERDFREPSVVEGFPAELRQVFTNILVNALEAAGRGGQIRIRMERALPEELRGAGTTVEIRDSGPGITQQSGENLFQPFYTTKGENGTGLGLWVSMGIVQKHGGTIDIVNGTDDGLSGARVRVYLPTRTLASAARRSTPHVS
jgi:PAS domain S-box-containing protein